jgi:hypothetical protein
MIMDELIIIDYLSFHDWPWAIEIAVFGGKPAIFGGRGREL